MCFIFLFRNGDKNKIVGAIEPNCSVLPVVEKAYENARFLCEQYYMNSPDLRLEAYDTTVQSPVNQDKEVKFTKMTLHSSMLQRTSDLEICKTPQWLSSR